MYSRHLSGSLIHTHIDDLRRDMNAARSRRRSARSHSALGLRQHRLGTPTYSIRTVVARFAH